MLKEGENNVLNEGVSAREIWELKKPIDVARGLIEDPSQLTRLKAYVEDELFIARTQSERPGQNRIIKFLKDINRNTRNWEWRELSGVELEPQAALEIVRNLPELGQDQEELQISPEQELFHQIAENLAKGFLNTRHEPTYDWRGCLRTWHTFLTGVLSTDYDLDILSKYYNLATDKYSLAADDHSLAWRSMFLGNRASARDDEEILKIANTHDRCVSYIAKALNKFDDYMENNDQYKRLIHQYACLMYILIEENNPSSKAVRKRYLTNRELIAKSIAIKTGQDFQIVLQENYPPDLLDDIPPDVVETTKLAVANLHRTELLHKYYEKNYGLMEFEDKSLFIKRVAISLDHKKRMQFPYTIFSEPSELRQKALALVDPTDISSIMEGSIREQAEKEGKSTVFFNQCGLEGAIVCDPELVPRDVLRSEKERISWVSGVIRDFDLVEKLHKMEREKGLAWEAGLVMTDYVDEGWEFHLLKEDQISISLLETVLLFGLPEERLKRSFDILQENIRLRKNIPQEFSQMPTLGGDRYKLDNHPEIPRVFGDVILRKNSQGGLALSMIVLPNEEISLGSKGIEISGNITFPHNEVEIVFDETTNRLPKKLIWAIEKIALSLLEHSCCPSINENDQIPILEQEEVIILKEGQVVAIPGRVVHIGVKKADGRPGEFTETAEGYFKKAMLDLKGKELKQAIRDLYEDSEGLSLSKINKRHREIEPECVRNLTWNRGFEPDTTPLPSNKKPPDRLFSRFNLESPYISV